MQYFFQENFIATIKTLLKKKSYKDCELAIIKGIFKPTKEELFANFTANRLNASAKNPIVKIRISSDKGKRSSYRLYFFAIIKKEQLYFGHLYPKTGSKGQTALSQNEEKNIIRSLLSDVKEGATMEVYLEKSKNKICYCSNTVTVW